MPEDERLTHIEQRVDELLEITEENNELLRQARREARLGIVVRVAIWAIVLALPFLLIGPILSAIMPVGVTGGGLFGLPSGDQLRDMFETYRSLELPQ